MEIYLLNTIGYLGNPYNAAPEDQVVHKPGTLDDPVVLRDWFDDARGRDVIKGLFIDGPIKPTKMGANQYEAEGDIRIWKIPPGSFRPRAWCDRPTGR